MRQLFMHIDRFALVMIAVVALVACRAVADTLIPEPLAQWSFDESDGHTVKGSGTLAIDGHIRGNAQRVDGLDGRALRLDGRSWVVFGSQMSAHIDDSLTIEAWVRPARFVLGQYYTLAAQTSSGDHPDWIIYHTGWNDLFGFYCYNREGGKARVDTFPGFLMDGWHHYVAVYDAQRNESAVYIDGVRLRGSGAEGLVMQSGGDLVLGSASADSASSAFEGDIDELRIYDYGLTDEQVIAAYMCRATIEPRDVQMVVDYPASMRSADVDAPLFRHEDNWVNEARVITHRFSRDVTGEQADAAARTTRELGGNTLMIEGYRYLLGREGDPDNWWKSMPPDQYIRGLRVIREACDRYGLKMINRITANVGLQSYIDEHPDFAGYDFRTGEKAWSRGYHYYLDMNNPAFVEDFLQTLERVMHAVPHDGLYVDETTYHTYSKSVPGGEPSRRLFAQTYGIEMNTLAASGVFDNMRHPDWRRWLTFRLDTESRFRGAIMNKARTLIDGGPFLSSTHGDVRPASTRLAGGDLERQSVHQTVNLYECEPLTPASWRNAFSEAKVFTALNTSTFHSYCASVSQQYFSWAFAKFCGMQTNLWPEFGRGPTLPLRWEARWGGVLGYQQTWSNVAIVHSATTNNLSWRYDRFFDELLGWIQALTDEHVPVRVVPTGDMTLEQLAKFDVVILPDVSCITDEQADIVRRYVAHGGRIIATGETGRFNELGDERETNALADVFGVALRDEDLPGSNIAMDADATLRFDAPMQQIDRLVRSNVRVLAKTERGRPAIVESSFGKGRVCYMSFRPGTRYFMPKVGMGWYGHGGYWYDTRQPNFRKLMTGAVREMAGPLAVRADHVPVGVGINPHRHAFEDARGIVVHMMNFLGAEFDTHAVAPRFATYEFTDYPSPAARLETGQTMSLIVQSRDAKRAYFISPDFAPVVRLEMRRMTADEVIVEVPDLPRYGFVYIVESKRDIIAETTPTMVDRMPSAEPFVVETVTFAEDFNAFSDLAARVPFPNWTGGGDAHLVVRSALGQARKGIRVLEIAGPGSAQLTTTASLQRGDEPAVYDVSLWTRAGESAAGSVVAVELLDDENDPVVSAAVRFGEARPLHINAQSVGDTVAMPDEVWLQLRLVADQVAGVATWIVADDTGRELARWHGQTPAVRAARSIDRLRLRCESAEPDAAFSHIFDDITVRRRVH